MTLQEQYNYLGRKQMIFQDAINTLQQTKQEFQSNQKAADAWGFAAVMSNVVLVPLNCIVNAFELGAAKDAYQILVKALYEKFSKSGGRTKDGAPKQIISGIQKIAVETLKKKGLTHYIPGVNILSGLALDSMAAFDIAVDVQKGSHEMNKFSLTIDRHINKAIKELIKLGIQRNEVMGQIQQLGRTA